MEQLKKLLMGLTAVAGSTLPVMACTGISLTAKDGSFVHARTIEWSAGFVPCEYVVIPRGQALTSYTPVGNNGLQFTSRYGVVGCAVAQKEFIVEGINYFLQRFYLRCQIQIALCKAQHGNLQNIMDRPSQNLQFVLRFF